MFLRQPGYLLRRKSFKEGYKETDSCLHSELEIKIQAIRSEEKKTHTAGRQALKNFSLSYKSVTCHELIFTTEAAMYFIKALNTLSLSPSRERGKCSSHAEAEWRLHRKSYNKLPCALSLTLRGWCSGRFLGEGRCRGGGSHDVWGHTTTQFQPWNFWVPFPTHWSQHCKIELRNNLSTYTVTDSNLVLDFILQHSNSMSRNHNIARGLSTQKVITQSPPLKKKKKKG